MNIIRRFFIKDSTPSRKKQVKIVYQKGDVVKCKKCGRKIRIDGPEYEEGVYKIVSADRKILLQLAFRCRRCNFITCWKCADKASAIEGFTSCPSCNARSPVFFTEWLRLKK